FERIFRVRAVAKRGSGRAGNADCGGRTAMECRSGKSAYGIRNCTRWHESQVKLWSARRSSSKDDTARKGHSKGCQGVQADRHAGKAARNSRKKQRKNSF